MTSLGFWGCQAVRTDRRYLMPGRRVCAAATGAGPNRSLPHLAERSCLDCYQVSC